MKILAIETSCDETSLAVVEVNEERVMSHETRVARNREKENGWPEFVVHENLVASQIKIHAPYGGVVPNLAKREHLKNLPILLRQIFGKEQIANRAWKDIDLIAVTVGPGLEPALWTGIEFAKQLVSEHKKPLVGANHLEGHLYSFLLPKKNESWVMGHGSKDRKSKTYNLTPKNLFPAIALIVSGGHTILLRMESFTKWKKLGETRDDAAGEAFDKVARILGLPYPGGPVLAKLALKGTRDAIPFPRPMLNQKNYDFSFSGLKTSVLYYMRDNPRARRADIAASFEEAVCDVLVKKTMRATDEYGAQSVILSGGVAANTSLREALTRNTQERGIAFFAPDMEYNGDNGAMIAAAAYMRKTARKRAYPFEAQGNMNI